METTLKRTWAEIDLDSLAYNLSVIRKQVGSRAKLLGVVKADAYGHGAVRIARELEALGADYLAVSNLDECEELRVNGVTLPILMLGYTPADQTERIVRNEMTQAVVSRAAAEAYSAAAERMGKTMRVHIKLDTGMGRLGFQCDDAHFDESLRDLLAVLKLPGLEIEGVFTHFCVSDADGAENAAFTRLQHERFARMIDAVERQGDFHFRLRHCCNAGGIARHPDWAGDMVRCGIILYGTGEMAEELGMKPVMTVKTTVSTIKEFESGMPVSYGRTFYTDRPSRIAVLPIGYADGLFRTLSNRLTVQTPYGAARQVGRICMDMCMIDVTDLPQLRPGDEVEVFGAHQPAETLARACGTISYELLCAVSKRVPRDYYRGGQRVDRNLQLLG